MMCSLPIVESEETIERVLQPSHAPEVLPAESDPPMLVQDRALEPLDHAVGPRVSRPRATVPHPKLEAPRSVSPRTSQCRSVPSEQYATVGAI